MAIEPKER